MKQATITLEMFDSGIHLMCADTGHDEFIEKYNGNKLIDIINEIQIDTDPNTTWTITDKGRELLRLVEKEGLSYEEADKICAMKFNNKGERNDEN